MPAQLSHPPAPIPTPATNAIAPRPSRRFYDFSPQESLRTHRRAAQTPAGVITETAEFTEPLVWLRFRPSRHVTEGEPGYYADFELSAGDSPHAAITTTPTVGEPSDILILWHGKGARPLTTHPAEDSAPVWSPDSRRIVCRSNRGGVFDLYVKDVDGGSEVRLLGDALGKMPTSWSTDRRGASAVDGHVFDEGPRRAGLMVVEGDGDPLVLISKTAKTPFAVPRHREHIPSIMFPPTSAGGTRGR